MGSIFVSYLTIGVVGVAAFDAASLAPATEFFGSATFMWLTTFADAAAPPAKLTRPAQHGTTLDPLHHICVVVSTQTTLIDFSTNRTSVFIKF
jgi:hypothetical protein